MHDTLIQPPSSPTSAVAVNAPAGTRGAANARVAVSASQPVHMDVAAAMLRRIRAVILLAGAVQKSVLADATGRSPLDLPLANNRSLLETWRLHTLVLAGEAQCERLPVRIMIDSASPRPALSDAARQAGLSVEVDPLELRGTCGLLKDICGEYDADDLLVVATAGQLLTEPLVDLVRTLCRSESDVSIMAHADGTPSSLMMVRCGCLVGVPDVGFIDFKEQHLPRLVAGHSVNVCHRPRPVGLHVRDLPGYIAALRWSHHLVRGIAESASPFAESWSSAGATIEEGATVHPSARLHDSVVLRGGRVEAGSVLVRSVVCGGAVVQRGRTIIDRLVSA